MTRSVWRNELEAEEPVTVRRCCTDHDSLEQVTRHLIRDFSRLDARTVAREVARAVAAANWIGLREDGLLIVELIARVQLELQCGARADIARLDPQSHPGRRATTSLGVVASARG